MVVIGFFMFFTFMFQPSQRVMDWLDERLEAPKAYKGFQTSNTL